MSSLAGEIHEYVMMGICNEMAEKKKINDYVIGTQCNNQREVKSCEALFKPGQHMIILSSFGILFTDPYM
jgi:hypothetical protein